MKRLTENLFSIQYQRGVHAFERDINRLNFLFGAVLMLSEARCNRGKNKPACDSNLPRSGVHAAGKQTLPYFRNICPLIFEHLCRGLSRLLKDLERPEASPDPEKASSRKCVPVAGVSRTGMNGVNKRRILSTERNHRESAMFRWAFRSAANFRGVFRSSSPTVTLAVVLQS